MLNLHLHRVWPKLFPSTSGLQLNEPTHSSFHCRCVEISWLYKMKYLEPDGGWVSASWFTPRPAFLRSSRGSGFNSERRATHKQLLSWSITWLYLACFSHFFLSPLCIELLSGGGEWALGQALHLWKICHDKCVENFKSLRTALHQLYAGGWASDKSHTGTQKKRETLKY